MTASAHLVFGSVPPPDHGDVLAWGRSLEPLWDRCHGLLRPGCRAILHVPERGPLRHPIVLAWERLGADAMGAILWQREPPSDPTPGVLQPAVEWILVFKKPGRTQRPDPEAKERARMTNQEWNTWFAGHWSLPEPEPGEPFPAELLRRVLRMYSFPGDEVLCPWPDHGPTGEVVRAEDRRLTTLPTGRA